MADAVARRRYAGDRSTVAVNQRAQEASGAHHEHYGAESKAGEAA